MHTNFKTNLVDEAGREYRVTDEEGNISKYRLYQGHKYIPKHFSAKVPERLEEIAKFPCRDDDILLSVYPKSGTHWLTNVVSMVVRGNTDYVGTPPLIDFTDLKSVEQMESPRILATHLPLECFPTGFKEGKSKIITISRNPKDVIVSYFTFMTHESISKLVPFYLGNWNGFVNFYMNDEIACDSWFDHVKMWKPFKEQFPEKDILFLNYENMKKNLYETIVKVGKFLGYERSDEFYKQVEIKCSFSNMKRGVNKGRKPDPEMLESVEGGILPIYRKGETGDWKNWFTVAQNEVFDALYERKLKGYDISAVYNPE